MMSENTKKAQRLQHHPPPVLLNETIFRDFRGMIVQKTTEVWIYTCICKRFMIKTLPVYYFALIHKIFSPYDELIQFLYKIIWFAMLRHEKCCMISLILALFDSLAVR